MRTIDATTATALAANVLVARRLFQITAIDISDLSTHVAYFWNDIGSITTTVIDGITGSSTGHTYTGSGSLITCDDIPLTNDISIKSVNLTLSQTNDTIDTYVRSYSLKNAAVQIHRALFNATTRVIIANAIPRFVGFCDGCSILTPTPDSPGAVTLRLVSHTRELTRTSTAKRSSASQYKRADGDDFFEESEIMGQLQIFWGMNSSSVDQSTTTPASGGGGSQTGKFGRFL